MGFNETASTIIQNGIDREAWEIFVGFLTHPVTVLILLGSMYLVHRLKYFFAQWLPLALLNFSIRVYNATAVHSRFGRALDLERVPKRRQLCSRSRKFLTWVLAFMIARHATLVAGAMLPRLLPVEYGWSLPNIANLLGFLCPFLVWAFFTAARILPSEKLRAVADALGAEEIDLTEQEREMLEITRKAAEEGRDPREDLTKTKLGQIFGTTKPSDKGERG